LMQASFKKTKHMSTDVEHRACRCKVEKLSN
jgi:hypothetical protein